MFLAGYMEKNSKNQCVEQTPYQRDWHNFVVVGLPYSDPARKNKKNKDENLRNDIVIRTVYTFAIACCLP